MKSAAYSVGKVVLSPGPFVAVLPAWSASFVRMEGSVERLGERSGLLMRKLINEPNRYAVPTETFRCQVLVELYQSHDAVLGRSIHNPAYRGEILLVPEPVLRLDPGPHHSKS